METRPVPSCRKPPEAGTANESHYREDRDEMLSDGTLPASLSFPRAQVRQGVLQVVYPSLPTPKILYLRI
jgi:hypothetical protein